MPSEDLPSLFAELPAMPQRPPNHGKAHRHNPDAPARVLTPNRLQVELHPSNLESLLPEGHQARLVWGYVEQQDLKGFYDGIKARQGGAGRSAIAPEILFALWLYATIDHVGNARELARLTLAHDAYRWICGGVQVNYHTLSDFRVAHGAVLDELLTDNLAALMAVGVVKLKRAAQDGVRVRASAGAASFRREDKLQEHLAAAREHVRALEEQTEADPGALSRQQAAARLRAAREREERIQAALQCLPEIEEIKRRQGKKAADARASSTDAEATVMKMGDGGFRPAYNTQLATDCDSQVIIGVDVVSVGSDMGQLAPMVAQVQARCAGTPEEWLVDGGYPKHEQLDAVSGKTTVYAPVPESKRPKQAKADDDDQPDPPEPPIDKHAPKAGDSAAVAAWRARMATDEAHEIYKQRAAVAECVNAQARNRGLVLLPVRGRAKVKCVALWLVLAHNLLRMAQLAPQLLRIGTGTSAIPAMTG
jgi:transposase